MKAAYYQGDRTFVVKETEPPPLANGEVRLDVAYCGVCGTDLHIYRGHMDARVQPPDKILGHEMSGHVSEVGPGVEGLQVGDPVVVRPLDDRGITPVDRGYRHICQNLRFIGIDSPGAFQNSWTVPAFTVHKLPAHIDMKRAALAEPLAVACHDARLAELQAGEFAVVLGGGPIGMLIALVARAIGARVLLSEVSPERLQLARKLGLDAVDPQEKVLKEYVEELTDGVGADVVFEVSGSPQVARSMTELPAIRGRIVVVAIFPKPVEIDLFRLFWRELKLIGVRVYEPEDYEQAIALLSDETLPLDALITAVEPLTEIGRAFAELSCDSSAMKTLIDCRR